MEEKRINSGYEIIESHTIGSNELVIGHIARAAAKDDPELAVNVEALKQVIPKDLSAAEISVRLGTTWIPQEDMKSCCRRANILKRTRKAHPFQQLSIRRIG